MKSRLAVTQCEQGTDTTTNYVSRSAWLHDFNTGLVMWHRGLARSSWTMRHRETSDQACKGSLHSQRQTFPCQQQRGLSNRFCAAPLLQSKRRTGGHLRGNGLWEAVKRCNCVKVRWKRTEQNDPQPEGILWWEITKERLDAQITCPF